METIDISKNSIWKKIENYNFIGRMQHFTEIEPANSFEETEYYELQIWKESVTNGVFSFRGDDVNIVLNSMLDKIIIAYEYNPEWYWDHKNNRDK